MSPQPRVQDELARARRLGEQLENLVVKRSPFPVESDRTILIIGYWSLLFDYHKSILVLLTNEFYGGAFALLRPMVEGLLRAHVALSCRPGVIKSLQNDKYSVDFKQIGPRIDETFGLEGFFENLLKRAEKMLHSYTHSGAFQLSRRFDGNDVRPSYSDDEVIEVITGVTSVVFMVTALTAKHLGFEQEWSTANEMFSDYGNR
jgi:hypothetical protein